MIRSTVNQSIVGSAKANAIVRIKGESIETIMATAGLAEVKGSEAIPAGGTTHYSNGHNGTSE